MTWLLIVAAVLFLVMKAMDNDENTPAVAYFAGLLSFFFFILWVVSVAIVGYAS